MSIMKTTLQYRKTVKFCMLLGMTASVLAVALSYLAIRKQHVAYYATTREGMNIPMYALSSPLVTNSYILQWSSIAVRQVMNLNFSSVEQQIDQDKKYFTDNGYSLFKKALSASSLYSDVVNKHLLLSVVAGKTLVVGTGVQNGRFYWDVQVPLLETVQSASETVPRHLMIDVRVSRVPALDSTQGILIDGFAINPVNKKT